MHFTQIRTGISFCLECRSQRFASSFALTPLWLATANPYPFVSPAVHVQIFRNALPPSPPNLTLTVSDTYGFGTGNLAAGRQRVALFGSLEPVPLVDVDEVNKCREAYLAGKPQQTWLAGHFDMKMRL